jgi:site-specific recombinase XerD
MYNDIHDYLEWKSTYTQKAALDYKLHLYRFANSHNKQTNEVTMGDLRLFIQHHKAKYSLAHTSYVITIIKNFFEYIRRQGKPCLDPYLIRPPKFTAHAHTPVTIDDFNLIDKLLSEYDFHELTQKVAIRLLWETGVRVSELCDLMLSDIDSQRQTAQIITKKNKQMRWIFWSKETQRLLNLYVARRVHPSPYLIVPLKQIEGRITPRSIQRWVKSLAKKAQIIKCLSPHSFRHGRAHHIINLGGGVVEVQKILGHSETNPQASFNYLRMNQHEAETIAHKYL